MLRKPWQYAMAIVCALTLACSSGKAPAEAAMKLADEAVAKAADAASKLMPDELKALTDELSAAKEAMAKGDYKAALAAAQSIPQKATDLVAKADAKKQELTASWNAMSADLPKMMDALKSRVDILSQSKKLPKGLDAAAFTSAKDGLAAATSAWSEAQAAFSAGNLTDAIAKGTSVKEKATAAMTALGMQLPG